MFSDFSFFYACPLLFSFLTQVTDLWVVRGHVRHKERKSNSNQYSSAVRQPSSQRSRLPSNRDMLSCPGEAQEKAGASAGASVGRCPPEPSGPICSRASKGLGGMLKLNWWKSRASQGGSVLRKRLRTFLQLDFHPLPLCSLVLPPLCRQS